MDNCGGDSIVCDVVGHRAEPSSEVESIAAQDADRALVDVDERHVSTQLIGERPRARAVSKPLAAAGPTVEIDEVHLDATPEWAVEYEVSAYRSGTWFNSSEVHAIPTRDLVVAVERIVRDEAPSHEDVLRRRLAEYYGVNRLGDRIKTAFDKAIEASVRSKSIERVEKVFLQWPGAERRMRTTRRQGEL